LFAAGDDAVATYVLVEGEIDITGPGGAAGVITAGFLGEEAALGLDRFRGSAAARSAARVIVLPRAALDDLRGEVAFHERVLTAYSDRFLPGGALQDEASSGQNAAGGSEPPEEPLFGLIGWLLAIIVPVAVIVLFGQMADDVSSGATAPHEGKSAYLVAVLGVAVVMWMFQLVPDFVAALFAVLCIILFGLAPPDVALGGFASTSFFMALSIFGLSAVITVSGLSYRILLWLLLIGPAHKAWYSLSLFLTGAALTPVVPSTNGRIAILAPFVNDLLDAMDEKDARREGPRLSASVLGGASLLSAVFLSSKSVNFLIFGLLPLQEQDRFQWLYWLFAASVCAVVLLVLYGLAVWLFFRNDSRPSIPKGLVRRQLNILGAMAAAEWAAVLGLSVLIAAFLTAALHQIAVPWVAFAIMFSLLIFSFLSPRDFRQRIDWSFLIYLASLIGLVGAMKHIGLDVRIAENLGWLTQLMEHDLLSFIAMLSAAIFVIRLALPINATVVIFAAVLLPAAVHVGANPWVVGFVILLLSENFIWPYQASYYAQYQSIVVPAAAARHPRLAMLHCAEYGMKLAAIYVSFPFWHALGLV